MSNINKYVRWANVQDIEYLMTLNDEFNGVGLARSHVEHSLLQNNELIALAFLDDVPVGFACAQIFKSFCYQWSDAEITELYVKETARRKGLASMLISFLEQEFRTQNVKYVKIVTGKNNESALKTYEHSNYVKKEYTLFQKKL